MFRINHIIEGVIDVEKIVERRYTVPGSGAPGLQGFSGHPGIEARVIASKYLVVVDNCLGPKAIEFYVPVDGVQEHRVYNILSADERDSLYQNIGKACRAPVFCSARALAEALK